MAWTRVVPTVATVLGTQSCVLVVTFVFSRMGRVAFEDQMRAIDQQLGHAGREPEDEQSDDHGAQQLHRIDSEHAGPPRARGAHDQSQSSGQLAVSIDRTVEARSLVGASTVVAESESVPVSVSPAATDQNYWHIAGLAGS